MPSTKTHANVHQRPGSVGSGTSKTRAATASSRAVCAVEDTSTWPVLPRKYAAGGNGVDRSRLRVPSSRSAAMATARFWKLDSSTPVATMPGRKYCGKCTPDPGTSSSSLPNTVAKIASMRTG